MKRRKISPNEEIEESLEFLELSRSLVRESIERNEGAISTLASMEFASSNLQRVILTYWRRRMIDSAKARMSELIDESLDANRLIRKFRLKLDSMYWFAFGRSALISYLLNDEFDPRLLKLCRPTGVPVNILKLHCLRVVDMNLALSIAAGKKIRAYDEFINAYYKNPRVRLAKKTYIDYGKLIDAVSKSQREQLAELIAICEENYLSRAEDTAYYNFDSNDGACRFNVEHVDYRLAAILKWAYRDHPKERKKLKTIHQWKWD